jgi:hypothetical protein
MKSEIIREDTRTVEHRKNQKAKIGDKSNIKVPIFRGLDISTFKYMRNNKYYPRDLLTKHDLGFILEEKYSAKAK